MKKIIGIIFGVFFLVMMAGCTQKTNVSASFYNTDIGQTSIVLSLAVDDPDSEITGTITLKLVRPDGLIASSKEVTDSSEYEGIYFTSLDNALGSYTIEVYATIGRDSVLVGSQTFTLPTAATVHITTTDEFLAMGSNRSGYYVLDNDLDFTGIDFVSPFISSSYSFSGIFDGQDHKISNVNFTTLNSYTGVFGFVSSGTIKNLTVDNVKVGTSESPLSTLTSLGSKVGILAGFLQSSGVVIDNVNITNSQIYLESANRISLYVGPIAGESNGAISQVTIDNVVVDVTHTSYGAVKIGGAIGAIDADSTISEVQTNASINFDLQGSIIKDRDFVINIGGLFGDSRAVTKINPVQDIVSTSDINVSLDFGTTSDTTTGNYAVYVGGLAGIAGNNFVNGIYHGSITLNHQKNDNESLVNKSFFVGGLIGYYGSQNKINQSLIYEGTQTDITINASDDVTLYASFTISKTISTMTQNVGVYGDANMAVFGVSPVLADESTVYTDLAGFFTSQWIQDALSAISQ